MNVDKVYVLLWDCCLYEIKTGWYFECNTVHVTLIMMNLKLSITF